MSLYFDNHASTPVEQEVMDAMKPFFMECYANAASPHLAGQEASEAVDRARKQIADLIRTDPENIFFTSGATESINWVLQSVYDQGFDSARHFVTQESEHKATLETYAYLEQYRQARTSVLPVDQEGYISAEAIERSILKNSDPLQNTRLVSLMGANNEVGTIYPIKDVAKICQNAGVLFHVDGAQWVGKLDVDVESLGIDFMSMSGHKIYGPKGVGALYISPKARKHIRGFMHGGSQECGLRGGTTAVPLVVGMGQAAALCQTKGIESEERIAHLRDTMQEWICERFPVTVNGKGNARLAGNLNLTFTGIEVQCLKARLRGVAFSGASACCAVTGAVSHVLQAMGHTHEQARSSLRFGLGRHTTIADVQTVCKRIEIAYEMFGDKTCSSGLTEEKCRA